MRLATFNVQHGRRADGPVDVELLAEVCAGLDADVLGLQELDVGAPRSGGADLLEAVAARCGGVGVFAPAMDLPRGGRYGVGLVVRGSASEVAVVRLPPGRRPLRRRGTEPRVALLATATVGGTEVGVAVCHLGVRPPEARAQLAAAVAALALRPAPRVLMGDLNLPPRSVAPVAEAAGLLVVRDGGATWPACRPVRRIDHVAVAGLTPVAVEVRATPVSDHRALVVDVS